VQPVLTAAAQRAADEAALASVGHRALVERAGLAAALAAAGLLDRVYGARVAVLCGPGSNGADGRVAARHLATRGADVAVVDAAHAPARLDAVDLVVDAAFGTGLSRPWDAPEVPPGIPVLAVDLPSGVDPDTGVAAGRALCATRTVAMGSIKRGHLLADGARLSGVVSVAGLGIPVASPAAALVDDDDPRLVPPLGREEHKWRRGVVVLAGAPGMTGAAALACEGALSVQAGMVLCCTPDVGRDQDASFPREAVRLVAPVGAAAAAVLDALARAHALVVGPGLGRGDDARRLVADVVAAAHRPCVLDADALHLVDPEALAQRQAGDGAPLVLTPHDGEYAALFGVAPGEDRFAAAERAAAATGCTVLLKGPTTVVATAAPPTGVPPLLAITSGTPDLATPGSGDVLAGAIGGLLARGLPAHLAAAIAAHVHGRAGGDLGATCRAGRLPGAIAARLDARGPRRRARRGPRHDRRPPSPGSR
jgi:ADP-dependent NAD(P)H-hydrate dehydratase / NAD(P)H-hydrate epimerase